MSHREALLQEAQNSYDLPVTWKQEIPAAWTDYNGHMNEVHYLEAAARSTDRFLEMIGADTAYVTSGKTFFTVETHIRYLSEVCAGERIAVTTQVLEGAGKKVHLFHRLWRGDDTLAATVETLLLHMDLTTRRVSLPDPSVAGTLGHFATAHAGLTAEGAGRFVGERTVTKPSTESRRT